MLHRLLTCLLFACLALQGATVAGAAEAPCPMETGIKAMVLAGELDPTDLPDCCNDMQVWAATGHLCKDGADCQSFTGWAPAPSAPGVAAVPSAGAPVALYAPTPNAPPGAPWRPPAAG